VNQPIYGILKGQSVHSCHRLIKEKHGRHAKMVMLILVLRIASLIVAWEGMEPLHLQNVALLCHQLATTAILVAMNASVALPTSARLAEKVTIYRSLIQLNHMVHVSLRQVHLQEPYYMWVLHQ
jgi:hypothetical protein